MKQRRSRVEGASLFIRRSVEDLLQIIDRLSSQLEGRIPQLS